MKIQYCSDLHLEILGNNNWIKNNPMVVAGDILVIAGDTSYLDENFKNLDFFNQVSDNFRQTYIIPGNHEFYRGYDVSVCEGSINEDLMDNVKLIHNDIAYEDGVKLIFSTMWARIVEHTKIIRLGITDFHRIKYKGKRFSPYHFNEIHKKCFQFIEKEVQEKSKKVVVTHHLPSELCNAPEHNNSKFNEAFCAEKTDFIANSEIDYWIYGHNHRVLPEIDIKGAKLVSNQLGYVDHYEHLNFAWDKHFEI